MNKAGKYFSIAYAPFQREARYCFTVDLFISLVVAVIFFLLNLFSSTFFRWIIPSFFLIEIIVNYRIGLLSRLESKIGAFISAKICISEIQDEYSASGRWNSIISKLYPPNLRVNRYRVIGKDGTGNIIKLRCAISGKKWQLIHDSIHDSICEGVEWNRLVTYGKLTHIILSFDDKDDVSYKYNRTI